MAQTEEQKKIKELEKTIEDLNAMVRMLVNNNTLSTQVQNNNSIDKDVTVVSLCNNMLNLSTEANGGGTVYTFNEFGEKQEIPYIDLKRIIKNNKKFIQGGKCYIEDMEVVKNEHLENYYKKILNDDEITRLLSLTRKEFVDAFEKITPAQQIIFKEIVMDKLVNSKNDVDMNIVQYLNEKFNTNLMEDVKYSVEVMKQQ